MITNIMGDLRNSSISSRPDEEWREHLEYIADLLRELQRMAEREGCHKLSRMLAISHAEAEREVQRRATCADRES